MPIFEYRCKQCGNEFEQIVLARDPEPTCPACQSSNLEKLLSPSAVTSLDTRKRNWKDKERKESKVRMEKDRSEDHHHDHEH
jgi:putative FmdB family regulatory protein